MSIINRIFERIEKLNKETPESYQERIDKLNEKLQQLGLRQLTPRSWIQTVLNAIVLTDAQLQAAIDLCPTVKHQIKIFGKLTDIPRFQKLYGTDVSYNYSGTVVHSDPIIPEFVQMCLDYSIKKWPEFTWNGALVNWYPDGSSYISAHSDDEKDLVSGAPILSFSFGSVRTFRVTDKAKTETIDIPTENGSMIAMGGLMQQEYRHEITKTKREVGPRINVTIRSFVNQKPPGVHKDFNLVADLPIDISISYYNKEALEDMPVHQQEQLRTKFEEKLKMLKAIKDIKIDEVSSDDANNGCFTIYLQVPRNKRLQIFDKFPKKIKADNLTVFKDEESYII